MFAQAAADDATWWFGGYALRRANVFSAGTVMTKGDLSSTLASQQRHKVFGKMVKGLRLHSALLAPSRQPKELYSRLLFMQSHTNGCFVTI